MAAEATQRRYAANVPRFLLFQGLIYCYLWMPIWVVFLQGRGMELSQIGTLDAIGWVLMALAEVPTGAIADRFGRKVSLAMGAALYAVAMFAFTAQVMSPVFVFGYLLWTTSNTLFSGAETAFLYDTLVAAGRKDEFEKLSGRTNAIVQGAQAVGSLGGALLASYDMVLCFTVAGGLSVLAALLALSFKEPPLQDEGAGGEAAPTFAQTIGSALRIMAGRPAVRYLVIFGAVLSVFPFLLTYTLFQPYASTVGLPVALLGIAVLLNRGAAILGSSMAHRISQKLGGPAVIAGGSILLVLSQVFLAAVPAVPTIVLFLVVAAVSSLIRPPLSAALNEAIPSSQRATVLSLQSLIWTLLLAVVEPIVMATGGRIGVPKAVGVGGMLLLLLLPVGLLWHRTSRKALQA